MIDYYKLLNIGHDATHNQIKKAYKRGASKWHPDRNNSLDATKSMQLINEAYLILSDSEARERYDSEYASYKRSAHQDYTEEVKDDFSTDYADYDIKDEVLKDWINKAKAQAKAMATQSLDDLLGMSYAAASAAYNSTKYWIIALIVVLILVAFLKRI